MTLNIFVLHSLGAELSRTRKTRKTSIDRALCFQRYSPQHQFYYHDIREPVSEDLKNIRFHAVIFDTLALCARWYRPRDRFQEIKDRLSFIADWDAVKIAFPQDDYDHSELLDDWLADYRFDVVYSVVWDHRQLLYPRMSKQAAILPALTGYVNDEDVAANGRYAKPFRDRQIAIGYRVKYLPAQFGSFGQMKGLLADRMKQVTKGEGIRADISTDPKDVLLGDHWLRFLGDCQFCLGSEGGSSIWDPRGEVFDRVAAFVERNPQAGYAEIEASCFPGLDRQHVFSAVSPRLFEAAMVRSGQILIEAPYLGVLEPWVHYLPIDETCETASEILASTRDQLAMERMIDACHETLIAGHDFRYSTHVQHVMQRVSDLVVQKRVQGAPSEEFARMVARQRDYSAKERRRARRPAARLHRSVSKLKRQIGKHLGHGLA